jgi:hypothetical protein
MQLIGGATTSQAAWAEADAMSALKNTFDPAAMQTRLNAYFNAMTYWAVASPADSKIKKLRTPPPARAGDGRLWEL